MWLINLLGFALIGLIVWWFWIYQPSTAAVKNQSDVKQ